MGFLSLFTTLLPVVIQLVGVIPQIKAVYDSATDNTLQKITTTLQSSLPAQLVTELSQVGSQLFPNLSPELHAAAAALIVSHPNGVAYAQDALNIIASTGFFQLPNNQPLKVDGIYGPHTMAAVSAFETKCGLPQTGFITDAVNNAIGALLAKV